MESIGVSSFALNHNKKSSPARLNMRLPSPKADIKPVAAKPLGDRPAATERVRRGVSCNFGKLHSIIKPISVVIELVWGYRKARQA
jgi:hypothetical protein